MVSVFSKKGDANWFVIGAILFVILLLIVILIISRQAGQQEGLISSIFSARP